MSIEKGDLEVANKSVILSKQSITISIPILIAIMITYYYNSDYYIYSTLIEIFCSSLGASLAIIAIMRRESAEGEIYKYIGFGYLFISCLFFIKIILNNVDFNLLSINPTIIEVVSSGIFLLEYFVVVIAFILNKRKISLGKSFLTYGIFLLSILLLYFIIYSTNNIQINESLDKVNLIGFLGMLVGLVCILIDKNSISKEEKLHLSAYLLFTAIYQILFYMDSNGITDCKFESGIFHYIAYYIMYESLAKFVLGIPYENMKRSLEKASYMQKSLNNILNTRNKQLRETKSVISKSEKRYGNLIETIRDGLIIFDFDRLSYINSAAKEILDYKIDSQIIGKNFFAMVGDLVGEELIRREFGCNIDYIENIFLEEKKIYSLGSIKNANSECELYILRIDGRNKIMYIKDISEVNKNYTIRKAYEEYLKEEELKNEFYSNISHELRTPINLIYSAVQLNDVHLSDGNLESIHKNNLAIKQNCLRLIRTINNFIDTNKISEGYIRPHFNSYNIVYLVENITLACNKYIEMNESQLVFDSSEEEIYCKCDREMLERVMMNLLSNSVKYGRRGGVVNVTITKGKTYGLIKVMNDGYSIDKEVQPYIFDKFTKINKSLSREREGSGLGLFLCKALIEIQNGTIELKYNNSGGSEFHIKLPISSRDKRINEQNKFAINPMEEKVDIEFSDIYL